MVALCCALPLAWMAVRVASDPAAFRGLLPTRFYAGLLARTLGYSVAVALLATVLALPAALALGRGRRGWVTAALWLLLPAALLMPSITYAYGWSQLLRLLAEPLGRASAVFFDAGSPVLAWLGIVLTVPAGAGGQPTASLDLAGRADVMRCVWTLATWLWPIPAGVLGLALRRVDPDVQQQALLDGALGRLTARQLAGPAAAAMACVVVLASQEFAVYEPTGISVVATEVRMVFETGAFSGADNPITQPFLAGGGAVAPDVPDAADAQNEAPRQQQPPPAPGRVPDAPDGGATDAPGTGAAGSAAATSATSPAQAWHSLGLRDQDARAGAAVATSLPLLAIAASIGTLGMLGVARLSAAGDEIYDNVWPRVLEAGVVAKTLALAVVLLTLLVPVAAMAASLHIHRSPATVWRQFSPQATGSLILAACAALVAGAVAFFGAVRPARGGVVLSLAAFLVGGQLLAIALIRLYNREAPGPLGAFQFGGSGGVRAGRDLFDLIYDGIPIVVMAYLARFGWLALLAGNFTRTRPWRQVRELLALDGATPAQSARHVIWPLAWPLLAASAVLVGVLSLTEVPATLLLSPLRPQPLIPMLMGWVHMLRYDDMIEGSLLLMGMAMVLALVAAGLILVGTRVFRSGAPRRSPTIAMVGLAAITTCAALPGCSDSTQPDEVWLETGTAPGQVVYPRAISYAPKDDSFFIVDRLARIQQLDARGHAIGGWRLPDHRVGKPVGLSVGPDGNVYVPDTHYHRVIVFTPDGKEVRRWGERGTKPGQFIWPTDIGFDDAGNTFVSEYGDNDRIQVFGPDGSFVRSFGSFGERDGEFSRPQSMVIDGPLVYVTDACNHRIGVFKTDGTFVRNMGTVGDGPGQFRFPFGMDEDKDGNLVVCEFGNNRVQRIDKQTGRGLGTFGGAGREPGQFAYPWAVALDRAGRVVALDSGNNRAQVFEF